LESSNETLSKVAISGGGRCNVMHNPKKEVEEIAKVKIVIICRISFLKRLFRDTLEGVESY
jgi:predicted flavoprotein YhiN